MTTVDSKLLQCHPGQLVVSTDHMTMGRMYLNAGH